MAKIKAFFYIAIWLLILSWLFGFVWAITITIVISVLSKIFKSPAPPRTTPAKERKTKVPMTAKVAASAYIGYKAGKNIGKW